MHNKFSKKYVALRMFIKKNKKDYVGYYLDLEQYDIIINFLKYCNYRIENGDVSSADLELREMVIEKIQQLKGEKIK